MSRVRSIYLVSVWVHVIAAMAWIGGMVLLVAAVMPWMRTLPESERPRLLDSFARRFGRVMWTTFGVMAVTGATNLWVRGVTLSNLIDPEWHATKFGGLILTKIALFLAAAVIGIAHARKVTPAQSRWLGRLSLAISLVIVAAAVQLVR